MWVSKVLSYTLQIRFQEQQRLFSHFYMLLVLTKNDKLLVPNMFSGLIAGRPKAALLFWFFGDFRCGALLFMVIHVIYKYKNK